MKKNKLLQSVKIIILGLVLSLGAVYVFSAGTTLVPINVGPSGQAKGGTLTPGSLLDIRGVLSSDSLAVFGNAVFNGNIKVDQLSGGGNRPICIDSSKNLIPC